MNEKEMHRSDTSSRWLSGRALDLAALCLVAMMVLGAADVIGLAVFSIPVPSATELSEVLLALAIFLPLMAVQRGDGHIKVDVLTSRMGPGILRATRYLSLAATSAVLFMLAWQATALAASSWAVREYANAQMTFPVYPIKIGVAIALWLAGLESLRQLALGQFASGVAAPRSGH